MIGPLLEALGRSDAPVVLANVEDLWGEIRPHNVPGTGQERPNWRRRAARPLEDILGDGRGQRRLDPPEGRPPGLSPISGAPRGPRSAARRRARRSSNLRTRMLVSLRGRSSITST